MRLSGFTDRLSSPAQPDRQRFSACPVGLLRVVSNYREAGISVFLLAYFVPGRGELRSIREAVGVPLRVVRLSVPLPDIERRLAADVTTERQEELREAAKQIAAGEGAGIEDMVLANDRPVAIVAQQVMTWLGWA